MKFIFSIIFVFVSLISFGQKSNFTLATPSQPTVIGCDTLTNTPIQMELGKIMCCYEIIDGQTWKRPNCDSVVLGSCDKKEKECRVGKSVYALWDNTGTTWNASYTFEVTYDDGSTEAVIQTPVTSGTWTGQLNQWASPTAFGTNDKCEYGAACNVLPNGCGGLNAPPTEVLESGEDISSMRWRYLNVKCCFTEKIPVKIEVVESSVAGHIGRVLDLIVFYGDEIEYEICGECGEDGEWLYYDSKEPVLPQDMPICSRPCGFEFPNLASPSCSFTYFDACDQNNLDENGNPKAIVLQYVDCGEGEIVNAIFEIDSEGALIDYSPIEVDGEASIDDCNGGVIVAPEPEAECDKNITTVIEYQVDGECVSISKCICLLDGIEVDSDCVDEQGNIIECPIFCTEDPIADFKCAIDSGLFDPDTGNQRDKVEWNGSNFIISSPSPAGFIGRWVNGNSSADCNDSDFIIAHVSDGVNSSWVYLDKGQIVGNGSIFTWNAGAFTLPCTNLASQITSANNNISLADAQTLIDVGYLVTGGTDQGFGSYNQDGTQNVDVNGSFDASIAPFWILWDYNKYARSRRWMY